MNRKIALAAIAAVLWAPPLYAAYVDFELEFELGDYSETEITGGDAATYILLETEGCGFYSVPGDPLIPTIAYDVVVPFGSTNVSAELRDVVYHTTEDLDYNIIPSQEPCSTTYQDDECPECWDGRWAWTGTSTTYNENEDYTTVSVLVQSKGLWRGHFAMQCVLVPVNYNPVTDELKKLDTATLRVNYTPPGETPTATRWEWEHIL